jgi:hypothetical protein
MSSETTTSAIVELNIRAKKHQPPKPIVKEGTIHLEVGKKYVLNNGHVVAMIVPYLPVWEEKGWFSGEEEPYKFNVWNVEGKYIGHQHKPDHPLHVKHEWFASHEIYKAWMAGKKIAIKGKNSAVWFQVQQRPEDLDHPLTWWTVYVDPTYNTPETIKIVGE